MTALWPLIRLVGPYLLAAGVAFGAGWWGAWSVQSARLAAADAEFVAYRAEQVRLATEREAAAIQQREQQRADYEQARTQLDIEIAKGATYRRCVAAGKCGPAAGSLCPQPAAEAAGTGLRFPTGLGTDAGGAGAVPAAGDTTPPVIGDCAAVQLQLNRLQAAIETQPGYRK